MTNEELDLARAKESLRLHPAYPGQTFYGLSTISQERYLTTARLAREGWVPTDPLLIEAREIAIKVKNAFMSDSLSEKVRTGTWDNHPSVQCALAALRSREPK